MIKADINSVGGIPLDYWRDEKGFVVDEEGRRLNPEVGTAWTLSDVEQQKGADHVLAANMRANSYETVIDKGNHFAPLRSGAYPATSEEFDAYISRRADEIASGDPREAFGA